MQSIVSISYNYIKLDRTLIRNINNSPVKKALLEAFMKFTRKINSKVIAEGIETKQELDTLIDMGIDYGQGYLIAKPKEEVNRELDIISYIIEKNKIKK